MPPRERAEALLRQDRVHKPEEARGHRVARLPEEARLLHRVDKAEEDRAVLGEVEADGEAEAETTIRKRWRSPHDVSVCRLLSFR
jgi:hypothetical protein